MSPNPVVVSSIRNQKSCWSQDLIALCIARSMIQSSARSLGMKLRRQHSSNVNMKQDNPRAIISFLKASADFIMRTLYNSCTHEPIPKPLWNTLTLDNYDFDSPPGSFFSDVEGAPFVASNLAAEFELTTEIAALISIWLPELSFSPWGICGDDFAETVLMAHFFDTSLTSVWKSIP